MIINNPKAGLPYIVGSDEGDYISGRNGSATYYQVNDIIIGGHGNDYMVGNGGNDIFVFRPGDGWDVIADFSGNIRGDKDTLDLTAFSDIKTSADVLARATSDGGDTIITLAPDSSIRLEGVSLSQFTAGVNFGYYGLLLDPPERDTPSGNAIYLNETAMTVVEGSGGGTTMVEVPVTRTGDLSGSATVEWSVGFTGGPSDPLQRADAGDFVGGQSALAGSVTFEAGQSRAVIRLPLWADDNGEYSKEHFQVSLKNPSDGYTVNPSETTDVAIGNDDAPAQVVGTFQNDFLAGGVGDELIIGYGGNDYMLGGGGSDTFIFGHGDGWDVIGDFQAGAGGDRLAIGQFSDLHSMADLTMVTEGNDLTIVLSASDTVKLQNVQAGQLTADNFLFAA
jgi:Ca2+-binding RTX toxin-like protein